MDGIVVKDDNPYNICEFIQGQKDCRDGVAHRLNQGESYNAGYSAQYELEQTNDYRSMKNEPGRTERTA